MKNTTDQNKYFEALNVITITGQTNNNLDSLLDNMFTEFDHNIIGLSFEMSQELLTINTNRQNVLIKIV